MATPTLVLELDTQRPIQVEKPYTQTKNCQDISIDNGQQSRVYQWDHKSITSKPINLTTDFVETPNYECLKFRLAGSSVPILNSAQTLMAQSQTQGGPWFSEVPMNTNWQGQPCDYFFNCIVPKTGVGAVGTGQRSVFAPQLLPLIQTAVQTLVNAQNFAQQFGVSVMGSADGFPRNQGYQIRWQFPIRRGQKRAGVLQFIFGDFCLYINNDGSAEIYQTADYQNWRLWESFQWGSFLDWSHEYSMTIYPHRKNQIEFVWTRPTHTEDGNIIGGGIGTHVFHCPWKTDDGQGGYTITKPGNWYMIVSKEIRPLFQVSLLGFYNGQQDPAIFFDDLQDVGFVPTVQPNYFAVADLNGCTFSSSLMTFPFSQLVSAVAIPFRTKSSTYQGDQFYSFQGVFQGIGDIPTGIPSVPPLSSLSAEFYAYTVDKPGAYVASPMTPVQVPVMAVDIDTGSSWENEHLQVTIDNSDGQLVNYKYRGHVPCRLLDLYYGICLFEGNWNDPDSFESSLESKHVRVVVRSMADELLGEYGDGLDFTVGNQNGNAWYWQNVLARCVEWCGISTSRVVFEGTGPIVNGTWTVPGSAYNFPLWNEIDGGGAVTSGTKSDASSKPRWMPDPSAPIYQFFDTLCRNIMGWHAAWSKSDSTLRIYKRPQPKDVTFANAKCVYFGSQSAMDAWQSATQSTLPSYLHRGRMFTTERPKFTTLQCMGRFAIQTLLSVQDILLQGQKDGAQIQDSVYATEERTISVLFDNPNGYVRADGTYTIGPDFRVQKKIRKLNLTSAGSIEAFQWISRRFFEDLCFGHRFVSFESDWGDPNNYDLRKWDLILVDPDPTNQASGWWQIDRIEPQWAHGSPRRARYRAVEYRPDAPPPR